MQKNKYMLFQNVIKIKDRSSRLVATDKGGYAYEDEANEVKTYSPRGLGAKGARLEYGGYALELTPATAEAQGVYSAGSSYAENKFVEWEE